MKTIENIKNLLSAHKKELETRYNVKEIGIFGSFAKGKQKGKE